MATIGTAYSSLMSTVSTTAGSVTDLVGTVGKGINMISTYVDDMSHSQRMHVEANKLNRKEEVKLAVAEKTADLHIQADQYRSKSAKHAEYFDAAYAELEQALKEF